MIVPVEQIGQRLAALGGNRIRCTISVSVMGPDGHRYQDAIEFDPSVAHSVSAATNAVQAIGDSLAKSVPWAVAP